MEHSMLDDEEEHRRQRRLTLLQCIPVVLVLHICTCSDYFLFQQYVFSFVAFYLLCLVKLTSDASFSEYLADHKLFRHLVDSVAHGGVAFCCWAIFHLQIEKYSQNVDVSFSVRKMLQMCFLNGITASMLDVDHFIAAGALSLAGATHLDTRPFGHAVTFIIMVAFLVYQCSRKYQARKRRYRVCFIIVAWFSHQLRDGMRRGLWIWPFGSTQPINYFLYLLMEEGLPFVMAKWWRQAPVLTVMEKLELALQIEGDELEGDAVDKKREQDRSCWSAKMKRFCCQPKYQVRGQDTETRLSKRDS